MPRLSRIIVALMLAFSVSMTAGCLPMTPCPSDIHAMGGC